MRISSLAFEGFGPYKERQFIDFDELGESGLYLINGPTGAGKTTIIDAICFALFGKLANDEADAGRLRSDFCGPTDPTRVELVFESAAGRFRVERSPEYMRAKARGEGETKNHAECKVHRIVSEGAEETIAHQVASANKELADKVGLTRDQFVQTVVLPQGKFADFLNSDTREREAILKSIFKTELYERVAAILKERAKAAQDQRKELTNEIEWRLQQVGDDLNLEPESLATCVGYARDSLDEPLRAVLNDWRKPLAEANAAAQQASDNANDAFTAADEVRELARKESHALQAVAVAQKAVESARQAVSTAATSCRDRSSATEGTTVEIDDSPDVATWRARVDEFSALVYELKQRLEDEKTLEAWPGKQQELQDALAEARKKSESLKSRQSQLPNLIAEQEAIQKATPAAQDVVQLKEEISALSGRDETRRILDEAVQSRGEMESAIQEAARKAERADEVAARAGLDYRAGIAAHLAAELEVGEQCAVCGSTEHPSPAQHDGAAVTFEDFQELQQASTRAHQDLRDATTSLEQLDGRIAELQEALTITADEDSRIREELSEREADFKARTKAASDADQVLDDLRGEQERIALDVSDMGEAVARQAQTLDMETTRIEELREEVRIAQGSFSSVNERLKSVQGLLASMQDRAKALEDLVERGAGQEEAEAALAEFPPRDGFGDLQAAQAAWDQAKSSRDEAARAAADAQSALQQFDGRVETIESRCRERAELVASDRDLQTLAAAFNPSRGNDYGLHIYILRTMFDLVMALANNRFESLLNGRYSLISEDDPVGDGRKLHGLGVAVKDSLTGKVRSAKSLSGGESFCASLALALGLSDAVQSNAGGIRIDSLFIDEGFGSLDNAQLDEVMNMLNHLSSHGRRVGLISHVDSMKEAITERIDVHAVRKDRPTSLTVSWMGE